MSTLLRRSFPFLVLLIIAYAAGSHGFAQQDRGGKVVISYGGGTPRHFNPAVQSGSSTAIVGSQIFASPLRYDENWNPQPYLAKTWKVSEDGRSVTLKLVEGATFHDGHPITSEDVAFSIMAVKQYHPFKSMFAPVERVDTPDPHTVIIRLSHPHPAILLAMSPALLPILPKHVYGDGKDLRTHPANLAPIGSGPFKPTQYVTGKSIVLKRNERYFIPGRPYLDEIVIRLEEDPKAQMIEMERQEAHVLPTFMDLPGLDRLSQSKHLIITPRGYEGLGPINWLAFNLLRKPLDDKRVRQAMAYAMDPEFITGYLHRGRSRRAPGPISPDSTFYTPDVHTYPVDLERAERLLDEAGYPRKPDDKRFSLTLDYIPVIPSQQGDVALYLKRQLARVGIDVRVRRSESFPEWAERIGNWDFDMTMDAVYNWGDPVIGVHRTYLSDNIRKGVIWSNTQNYRNRRVDEILKQAAMEADTVRRKALYSEFQQILTEELPVIWINVMPFHTVYHAGLGNSPMSIWGVHSPLDEVYWKNPPVKEYVPTPILEDGGSPLKQTGVRAIDLLKERGLFEAVEAFKNPNQGFLDLEGSGLHVIGLTDNGIVFLDNSGQMNVGMDISGILDLEGKRLLPQFMDAAKGKNDGLLRTKGSWPHPRTHESGLMSAWCGMLTDTDAICVLEWER
ncbi:ABC transporter substrate-binding protein [Patescibacteria group bacterium]|nr:ABC transporter substrate-binding protein [Patescibacteria group bacterium]